MKNTFPEENVLQFLHGQERVQSQGCLWFDFGSGSTYKFSFSRISLTPADLENMRMFIGDTILRCYIVSIGIKYIQEMLQTNEQKQIIFISFFVMS